MPTINLLLYLPLYLGLLLSAVVLTFYAERKLAAFIQNRMGPTEVGKFGLLQAIADLLKLVQKEDISPSKANTWVFKLAPLLIFICVFVGMAFIPLNASILPAPLASGMLWLVAIVSLDIIGLMAAGWASRSKFSTLGAIRAVGQMISFEVPLSLCLLIVVIYTGSLNLQEITLRQGGILYTSNKQFILGVPSAFTDVSAFGGLLCWNIVTMPLFIPLFLIFYICILAECNRAPFDLPEGESEIVGGFHTEYSGLRWAIFFLSEYSLMVIASLVAVILFFGGWHSPLPDVGSVQLFTWTSGLFWGVFWLFIKTMLMLLSMVWVRWSLPRVRVDQLMYLCWKVLTPILFLLLLLLATWKMWLTTS
jgi:NADH-quinone oxidoreductase subunit H